jgi:tRNA dimethylallyltransferase
MTGLAPLIVILGPTASGKSTLGLELAQKLNGEILVCDSTQIYRHFDIGTGKIPPAEQQGIAHHLVDLLDPEEIFTAGEYRRRALEVLDDLRRRKKLPIITAGTGLYLRALLEGLADTPERSAEIRDRLRASAQLHGAAHLHRLLTRLDPESAARIAPPDTQKIIRAIEMRLVAGKSATEIHRGGRTPLEGYQPIRIGLAPPREALYQRIHSRIDAMIQPAGSKKSPSSSKTEFPRTPSPSNSSATPNGARSSPKNFPKTKHYKKSSSPPAATPNASSLGFAANQTSTGSPGSATLRKFRALLSKFRIRKFPEVFAKNLTPASPSGIVPPLIGNAMASASPALKTSPLQPEDWIRAAFARLASEGIEAVRVELLARDLGVSKGSFYWHFQDREELLGRMFDRWEKEEIDWLDETVITPKAAARWARFVHHCTDQQLARLESAMRTWARRDERVAARIAAIEKKRTAHIASVLRAIGFAPAPAESWAEITLLVYLGWLDRVTRDLNFQNSGRTLDEFFSDLILAASDRSADHTA